MLFNVFNKNGNVKQGFVGIHYFIMLIAGAG